MTLALNLLLAAGAGFLGHLTRPILRRDFESGWFPISCYVVGTLLALPFVLLNVRTLQAHDPGVTADDLDATTTRPLTACILAFGGVGAGVVAGHYWRPDHD